MPKLDDVTAGELEVLPLQQVQEAIIDIGGIVQACGEADVADTVIILILTKDEVASKKLLEVHFAGDPNKLSKMMEQGSEIIAKEAKDAKQMISQAESEADASDPWNYI